MSRRSHGPSSARASRADAGDFDVVALLAQHLCQELAHDLLVVDDQDPFDAAGRRRRDGMFLARRRMRDGQPDREGGAKTGGRAHVDRAAALRDDPVDRREAEAGAFADILRREERLEDADASLVVHPDAVVRDLEHDLIVVVSRRDRQRPVARHGVPCVHGEVQEHLPDLARVGLDRPQGGLELELHLDAFADQPAQHRLDLAHAVVEVDDARLQHLAAAEREQLVRERGRALARRLDLLGVVLLRWVGRATSTRKSA